MATPTPSIPQAIRQPPPDRTTAERRADLEARRRARLAAMTPEQRQAIQARIDRINAVPVQKRPAFIQAWRLAMVARSLKGSIEAGVNFDGLIDSLEPAEIADLNWLADRVLAARTA